MDGTTPRSIARRRPVPDDLFGGRLKDCQLLDLEVESVWDLAERLRSIRFRSPDLVDFAWNPGQDIMFAVPDTEPPVRRRYTIRRGDGVAGTLDIEVVLHGDGPFARWAADVQVGDRIDGIGPRGVVGVRGDAAAHLFVGDESAIPAVFVMADAIPSGAPVAAVIATEDGAAIDALDVPSRIDVTWTTPAEVADVVASMHVPPGAAAYINGERSLVRAAADALARSGIDPDAVVTKSYWRRDQPNAGHGEPARD